MSKQQNSPDPAGSGGRSTSDDIDFHPPTPSGLTRGSIELVADELRPLMGYESGGDLRKLVERLGGKVIVERFDQLDATRSGSIRVFGAKSFEISLSNLTPPLHDRFTIAHELGHYFLHSEGGKRRIVADRKDSKDRDNTIYETVEKEADWFAAALLMPAAEFRACARTEHLSSLSARFFVSFNAVIVRARSLGVEIDGLSRPRARAVA